MAISSNDCGREYRPDVPYLVTREKITEFVAAIGEEHPQFLATEPIAPPTFAMVIAGVAWQKMFADENLGLQLARTVHADQVFNYQRPIRVGDEILPVLRIENVRHRAGADWIQISVTLHTVAGEQVCETKTTLLHTREVTNA